MDLLELLGIGAAGFVAGAINAVAGGGSLISFPALVAIGYPPITANATNTVALVPGYLGGSIGYRRELVGQERRLRRLGAISVCGALVGSVLLVVSPPALFRTIAPILIVLSCVLLVTAPRIQRRRDPLRGDAGRGKTLVVQFATAVYGAYFGAGVGILMLATFSVLIDDDLQRLNALKGAVSLIISGVAAVAFALLGRVGWTAAAVIAVTSLAGGRIGVIPARLLKPGQLRGFVLGAGILAAVWLVVSA